MVQEKICNIVNSLEVQILYVQHKEKADFKTNFSKMVYGQVGLSYVLPHTKVIKMFRAIVYYNK